MSYSLYTLEPSCTNLGVSMGGKIVNTKSPQHFNFRCTTFTTLFIGSKYHATIKIELEINNLSSIMQFCKQFCSF